jgi:hypothetical protein
LLPILQCHQQGSPPSRFPSQSSHRERDTPHPKPLSSTSQGPQYLSPLQFAQLSPHEERCLAPEPSLHNLQDL